MDSPVKKRSRWSLTPEAFEKLLERLSPDPVQAAKEFEQHHRFLVTLLTYAGASDPEHLADLTLDRAAKRLAEGEVVENLRAWLRGAARLVLQEERTTAARQTAALVSIELKPKSAGLKAEADHLVLERCLDRLGREGRSLVERYYQHGDGALLAARKRLAEELGISIENLRTKTLPQSVGRMFPAASRSGGRGLTCFRNLATYK